MIAIKATRTMRRYLADTFAMVMFSTIVGAFVEVVIAGLTLEQSTRIRLMAIPVMLFIGRPYGIYRNWLFNLLRNKNTRQLQAAVMDTFANTTFQVPVYCGLLALNGASIGQMVRAAGSVAVIAVLSGRPYGVFLVWCRRLFGIPAHE